MYSIREPTHEYTLAYTSFSLSLSLSLSLPPHRLLTALGDLKTPRQFDAGGSAEIGVGGECGAHAVLEVLGASAHVVQAVVILTLHVHRGVAS